MEFVYKINIKKLIKISLNNAQLFASLQSNDAKYLVANWLREDAIGIIRVYK